MSSDKQRKMVQENEPAKQHNNLLRCCAVGYERMSFAMQLGVYTFWRNMPPPTSGYTVLPVDGGCRFLQNIGTSLPI